MWAVVRMIGNTRLVKVNMPWWTRLLAVSSVSSASIASSVLSLCKPPRDGSLALLLYRSDASLYLNWRPLILHHITIGWGMLRWASNWKGSDLNGSSDGFHKTPDPWITRESQLVVYPTHLFTQLLCSAMMKSCYSEFKVFFCRLPSGCEASDTWGVSEVLSSFSVCMQTLLDLNFFISKQATIHFNGFRLFFFVLLTLNGVQPQVADKMVQDNKMVCCDSMPLKKNHQERFLSFQTTGFLPAPDPTLPPCLCD